MRDAGEYIAALPETVHDQPERQAAPRCCWWPSAFDELLVLVGGAEGERLSGFDPPRLDFHERVCALAYAKAISMHFNSNDQWLDRKPKPEMYFNNIGMSSLRSRTG